LASPLALLERICRRISRVLALMKRLGAVVLKVRSFHLPVVAALLFPMLTQLNVVQLYKYHVQVWDALARPL